MMSGTLVTILRTKKVAVVIVVAHGNKDRRSCPRNLKLSNINFPVSLVRA